MSCILYGTIGFSYDLFSLISAAADAEGRQVVATGGTGAFVPPAPPADEATPVGYPEEQEEPVHDMDTS